MTVSLDFVTAVPFGTVAPEECVHAITGSDLFPSSMGFFLFPQNECNKKGRNVTSRVKIRTPMIVHCLHLFIRFSEAGFFPLICWIKSIQMKYKHSQ